MSEKWWDDLKSHRATLREVKRNWRRKHFGLWLMDCASNLVLVGLLIVIGYFSGQGIIDGNESGVRTIGGIFLEDGSWNLIVDPDYVTGNDVFWAKRQYLECIYSSFQGPIVRRYWIGSEIELGREPSRLEALEFDRFLLDYFGEVFLTYDQAVFQREAGKGMSKLGKGCPFTPYDARLIPSRR